MNAAIRSSESGLIAALLARVPHRKGLEGPGDDCAVLSAATRRVITTDALIEGTHFLRAHPPESLGYKALAVNLSDVAAMGATPEGFLLSIALPEDLAYGWWEAFCEGLGACARENRVVVAGGDTVRSPGPISMSITAWGVGEHLLVRTAGRPGDVLMVAGSVGRSGVGLTRWLEACGTGPSGDLAAQLGRGLDEDFAVSLARSGPLRRGPAAGRAAVGDLCLRHHLRPEPPLWAGPLAASLGVRCGLDLSDGLATDLPRLALASGVRLEVDLALLPADPALAVSAVERAQTGEDYGLAILAPPDLVDTLAARGFVAIGRALPPALNAGSGEASVIWRLGAEVIDPPAPAFGHFAGDSIHGSSRNARGEST